MLYVDLIQNVAIIVALSAGLEMLGRTLGNRPRTYRWTASLLFGLVGVVGMMSPVHFSPGIIYDGRSIILTLAGLFCGPAALLAAFITSVYRLHLGGAGALAGVGVIVEATLLGIAVYFLRRRDERWVGMWRLWGLGFVVHALMMALQLLIPGIEPFELMSRIGLAVVVFFPLAFLLCARFFLDTERRRAETAERNRLITAIEQVDEIIFITDLENKVVYVNPAFERITGFQRNRLMGRDPSFLLSSENDVNVMEELFASARAGKPWRGRLLSVRKDKSTYPQDVSVAPVFDESGRIVLYVTVAQDISEQVELEERFQHAQRLESVGRLAGGVAHDLNNLLSPILGFSELILAGLDPSHPHHGFAQNILKASERARDIVGQLLSFSRKQIMSFAPMSLNGLLRELEPLLRRTLREDIHLRMRLDPSLPDIQGDSGQLGQVIMNLTVNAQDAMTEGGELVFETSCVELSKSDTVQGLGLVPGRFAVMTVRDTGAGIAQELLSHIFEPFFTTKDREKGTGLGLSTSHGIITQHGGAITVDSTEGRGTSFTVYFPEGSGEDAEAPAASREETSQGSATGTILIAEDDEQVAALARVMLESEGFTIRVATSAEDALDIAKNAQPPVDLLLTDVIMPDMNGRQLYEGVQAHCPSAAVLYMSGYTDDVIAHRGVLEEGVHFIPKPFKRKDIIAKVKQALGSGSRDR